MSARLSPPSFQMCAQEYDSEEVSANDIELEFSEDVESFDEVVVMRLRENQEPQLVEITNPVHKILVARVN